MVDRTLNDKDGEKESPKIKLLLVSPLFSRLTVPLLLGMSHLASWLHLKMEKEMFRPGHLNFKTLTIRSVN